MILVTFQELTKQVEELARGLSGTVAVSLLYPETGESYEYHADETIYPASVIKIALLVEFFHQVTTGLIDPNRRIKVTKENRVEGSGVIKLMHPDNEYTLKDLATLMITHSDNSATNQLIDILGTENINQCLNQNGMTHSIFKHKMMIPAGKGPNETTARDIGRLLERIYRHQVDHAEEIVTIMNEVILRDRIPRDLPNEVRVAHKTGDAEELVHDAGIIYAKNPFILVFLSEGQADRNQVKEVIAQVATLSFDYASSASH